MHHSDYPPPRALSVRQPWASALFYATPRKNVENRSWRTNFRGPLFVHASLRTDPNWESSPMAAALAEIPPEVTAIRGAILGMVELSGIVRDADSPWARRGAWHWQVEEIFPMIEIAEPGRLSLWVPDFSWLRPGGES